ncbi:hypothetical protein [Gemmatimonas sp.]|jgi:hypothetical protein|uniref:hypothetical protein n=1 Tax=Gemmatimonas sp. TaxID=1962908 RepID=UPI0037BF8248
MTNLRGIEMSKPRLQKKKRSATRAAASTSLRPKKEQEPATLLNLNTRTGPPKPKNSKARGTKPKKTGQRTWICIHIPEKMTYGAASTHPGRIETGKLELIPEHLVGDRIWLVGKSESGDFYDLYGHFIADSAQLGSSDGPKKDTKLIVSGQECVRFREPIRLNGLSWWTRYAKDFQGLSHGLQSVKDPTVMGALEGLRSASGNTNRAG